MNAAIEKKSLFLFLFRKSVSEERRKKCEEYLISAQKTDSFQFSCVNPHPLGLGIVALQDFL
ncbi:hypothetical protein J4210_04425 [Candidatus Woesearchaeota archaeon]|nr:hypothetical protein [Candidatus Woesearchaeota archaeon]